MQQWKIKKHYNMNKNCKQFLFLGVKCAIFCITSLNVQIDRWITIFFLNKTTDQILQISNRNLKEVEQLIKMH